MFSKKNKKYQDAVIIDEQIVSVTELKRKARNANLRFWGVTATTAMIGSMILPYVSMAAVAPTNSTVFTGDVAPGYSMGGVKLNAYGVDLNSWSQTTGYKEAIGSTYGVWSGSRLSDARSAEMPEDGTDAAANAASNTDASNYNLTTTERSEGWNAITNRTSYSLDNPDGIAGSETQRDNRSDSVAPYRTESDRNYWDAQRPSSNGNASANIEVSLFADFIVVGKDANGKPCILQSPDEVTNTNDTVRLWRKGDHSADSAVPIYIPLSALFDAAGIKSAGDASMSKLMSAIAENPRIIESASSYNLLDGTEYKSENSGNRGSSAFNPYPYTMVFRNSDKNGTVVSSMYNNTEAYVYFAPSSVYNQYMALRQEYEELYTDAKKQNGNTDQDQVTVFQLGYYAAEMAIMEAYLNETLPQDMTRGYVGPSEPQLAYETTPGDGVIGSSMGTSSYSDLKSVSYSAIMYDVASNITGENGAKWKQPALDAIMDTLSVFGYANKNGTGSSIANLFKSALATATGRQSSSTELKTGVMRGLNIENNKYRITLFSPYVASDIAQYQSSNSYDQLVTEIKDSAAGMYVPTYYPIQQHKMPDVEKSYRFQILSSVPFETLLDYIKNDHFSNYVDLLYRTPDSEASIDSFASISDAKNKVAALAAQYEDLSGEEKETSEYTISSITDPESQLVIFGQKKEADTEDGAQGTDANKSNTSQKAETAEEVTAKAVDSALMGYEASSMTSDNVHDLFDVIRATKNLKEETWLRFYNPIKSEGGDNDLFITRVSPANTTYMPAVLFNGYIPAGGPDEVDNYVSPINCSFDYFSYPSFAACFHSHTAQDTYYGIINYELRTFFSRGFIRTLSDKANIPAVEKVAELDEQMDELAKENSREGDVMNKNIAAVYVMAKRLAYFEAAINLSNNPTFSNETLIQQKKKGYSRNIPDNEINASSNGWTISSQYFSPVKSGTKFTGGASFSVDIAKSILGADGIVLSPNAKDNGSIIVGALPFKNSLNAATSTTPMAGESGHDVIFLNESTTDKVANALGDVYDGIKSIPIFGWGVGLVGDTLGGAISAASDTVGVSAVISQLEGGFSSSGLFDYYYQSSLDELLGPDGAYYWEPMDNIKQMIQANTKYQPDAAEGCPEFKVDEANKNCVYLVTSPANKIGFEAKTFGELMNEYQDQIDEACSEIGTAVQNIASDISVISNAMPTKMQNCLAWADTQNPSDSTDQWQSDPTQDNVVINLSTEVNTTVTDNVKLEKAKDLKKYGLKYTPSNGTGDITITADSEETKKATALEGKAEAGVEGATATATVTPAVYSISATMGRVDNIISNNGTYYPYSGLANGRMYSGADNYAKIQSHVVDYASIAAGVAGDLASRQRSQVVSLANPQYSTVDSLLDLLNVFGAFLGDMSDGAMKASKKAFTEASTTKSNSSGVATSNNIGMQDVNIDLNAPSEYEANIPQGQAAGNAGVYQLRDGTLMNRVPASMATFNKYTGQLEYTSPVSTASSDFNSGQNNADAAISSAGIMAGLSNLILTVNYIPYSIMQTIALTMVMFFLIFIAFHNFFAYSMKSDASMVKAQMELKVVLPRSIIAIFMIGLPPLGIASMGFEGGNFMLLRILADVMNLVCGVFLDMNSGGIASMWNINYFATFGIDIFAYIFYFLCSLIISGCFFIGCICIFFQNLCLLFFYFLGPLVWAFFVWPYNVEAPISKENKKKAKDQQAAGGITSTIKDNVTSKMNLGFFSGGRCGNLAPLGHVYNFLIISGVSVIWTLMFWFVSMLFTGIVGAQPAGTANAATTIMSTGYPSAAAALTQGDTQTDVFSALVASFGPGNYLRILIATIICLIVFWFMQRSLRKCLKKQFENQKGTLSSIGHSIANGVKGAVETVGKVAKTAAPIAGEIGKNLPEINKLMNGLGIDKNKALDFAKKNGINPLGADGKLSTKNVANAGKKALELAKDKTKQLKEMDKSELKDKAKSKALDALDKFGGIDVDENGKKKLNDKGREILSGGVKALESLKDGGIAKLPGALAGIGNAVAQQRGAKELDKINSENAHLKSAQVMADKLLSSNASESEKKNLLKQLEKDPELTKELMDRGVLDEKGGIKALDPKNKDDMEKVRDIKDKLQKDIGELELEASKISAKTSASAEAASKLMGDDKGLNALSSALTSGIDQKATKELAEKMGVSEEEAAKALGDANKMAAAKDKKRFIEALMDQPEMTEEKALAAYERNKDLFNAARQTPDKVLECMDGMIGRAVAEASEIPNLTPEALDAFLAENYGARTITPAEAEELSDRLSRFTDPNDKSVMSFSNEDLAALSAYQVKKEILEAPAESHSAENIAYFNEQTIAANAGAYQTIASTDPQVLGQQNVVVSPDGGYAVANPQMVSMPMPIDELKSVMKDFATEFANEQLAAGRISKDDITDIQRASVEAMTTAMRDSNVDMKNMSYETCMEVMQNLQTHPMPVAIGSASVPMEINPEAFEPMITNIIGTGIQQFAQAQAEQMGYAMQVLQECMTSPAVLHSYDQVVMEASGGTTNPIYEAIAECATVEAKNAMFETLYEMGNISSNLIDQVQSAVAAQWNGTILNAGIASTVAGKIHPEIQEYLSQPIVLEANNMAYMTGIEQPWLEQDNRAATVAYRALANGPVADYQPTQAYYDFHREEMNGNADNMFAQQLAIQNEAFYQNMQKMFSEFGSNSTAMMREVLSNCYASRMDPDFAAMQSRQTQEMMSRAERLLAESGANAQNILEMSYSAHQAHDVYAKENHWTVK